VEFYVSLEIVSLLELLKSGFQAVVLWTFMLAAGDGFTRAAG